MTSQVSATTIVPLRRSVRRASGQDAMSAIARGNIQIV